MTNEQMTPGRFERWARCRKLYARITDHLKAGRRVQVSTYLRSTVYGPKHLAMFTCGRSGVYVAAGKRRDDIQYCGIRLLD